MELVGEANQSLICYRQSPYTALSGDQVQELDSQHTYGKNTTCLRNKIKSLIE